MKQLDFEKEFNLEKKKIKKKVYAPIAKPKFYIDRLIKKYPEFKKHSKETWFNPVINLIIDTINTKNVLKEMYLLERWLKKKNKERLNEIINSKIY